MRLASIAMYVAPPPVLEATRDLWTFLQAYLQTAGLPDAPLQLDQSVAHDAAWVRPDLLLAQTCGYPYVTRLRGRVRLVATPVYDLPGCDGPLMRSFIVVHQASAWGSLKDLRGSRAAINSPDSNSGSNLFRAEIAPFAENGRFFSEVIETGGHGASMDAVSNGQADVAAIDCVTYGLIKRFDPQRVSNLRILAQTKPGPGLPFVTAAATTDRELGLLREALLAAIAEPSLASARDTLSLSGFVQLADADYESLLDFERQAATHGYPRIA